MDLVLGIGGNQGNRIKNLEETRKRIENQMGRISKISPLLESEPWGFESDNWFINQVIVIDCSLEPKEVLERIHKIEADFGRVRSGVYSDRLVDIDVLFYGGVILKDTKLRIPHPQLTNRLFVLKPLAEILPNFIHPEIRQSCLELLNQCTDQSVCRWHTNSSD